MSSTTSKQSEDVTSKTGRPQAFAAPMTQFVFQIILYFNHFLIKYSFVNREPVISRVAPMAPSSGRQIGVATPMTASNTSTTTSASLWTGGTTTETTTACMYNKIYSRLIVIYLVYS